jgi:integrase
MRRVDEFLNTQHSLGPKGKLHYIWGIKAFDRLAGAHFEDVYLDAKAIHATLTLLEKEKADSSWNLYLGVYKRYSKWLYDPDDMDTPKCWKKIKFKPIDHEELLKDAWFTQDEFRCILEVVDYPRDKALYACIIEGALRIGEALGLRIRDCKPARYGNMASYDVTVTGKTGTSSFPMVMLAPLLTQWLNVHPQKHDPAAFLWIVKRANTFHGSRYRPLKDGAVNWQFKRYCKEAGITRPVHIHMLRSSKITWSAADLVVGLSDEMAKKCFRWKKSSRMYSHYVRAAGLDSKKAMLALQGIREETSEGPKPLAATKCLGCGELNAVGALYCGKCGLVLDVEQAKRIVAREQMLDRILRAAEDLDNKNAER